MKRMEKALSRKNDTGPVTNGEFAKELTKNGHESQGIDRPVLCQTHYHRASGEKPDEDAFHPAF